MCNSLIFINFISRSKKVKPKSKSCEKHFFTVYKLLRLWYFVSVLTLKFLDQLERGHCKDTPFFRPFYIGAPKGPFLWGLRRKRSQHRFCLFVLAFTLAELAATMFLLSRTTSKYKTGFTKFKKKFSPKSRVKTITNVVGFLIDIEVRIKYLSINNLDIWYKCKSIYLIWEDI